MMPARFLWRSCFGGRCFVSAAKPQRRLRRSAALRVIQILRSTAGLPSAPDLTCGCTRPAGRAKFGVGEKIQAPKSARSVRVGEMLAAPSVPPSVLLWPEWSRAALGAESDAPRSAGAASAVGPNQYERSRGATGISLRSSDFAFGVSVASRQSSGPGLASIDYSSAGFGEC